MKDKDTIIREQEALINKQSAFITKLTGNVEHLLCLVKDQSIEIQNIKFELQEVKSELAEYKNPKNSGNSSLPPSHDIVPVKRNQSLREKSGKKSGGQTGHPGSTLQMTETPDEVIIHMPDFCECCGNNLRDVEPGLIAKRQVVDIPPVLPVITQHEVYAKKCSCGQVCQASFPSFVSAPIQYGPCIEGLTAYLSVRQYMPFARITELYKNLFSLDISEGSIQNMLLRVQAKFEPLYYKIKSEIAEADVVGTDETGAKIDGKKAWIWTWQNKNNTFLHVSFNRGKETIKEVFPGGLPKAILVSDALAAQLSTEAKGHQLCLAHMNREINHFLEMDPGNQWALKMKKIFSSAQKLKGKFIRKNKTNPKQAKQIESQLLELLNSPPEKNGSKLFAFYKRLVKHCDSVFQFLHHLEVPPDNNHSEQSIRNVKIKQKVSGQFKSLQGAQIFVVLRSVIDTLIKREQNIFKAFQNIGKMVPE